MCFCASASFGAAALLGGMGIWSLSVVRKKNWIPFAAIPVLFAIQQFIEGLLWLYLVNPNNVILRTLQKVYLFPHVHPDERSAFLFLIIALVVWPTWIPFSIRAIEPYGQLRQGLTWLMRYGVLVSAYALYILLWHGVSVMIAYKSIAYYTAVEPTLMHVFLYAGATVVPLLVSSMRTVRLFGLLLLTSCFFSYWYWLATFTSVWCFFAALLSGLVIFIVKKNQ
ncbi:hypothetical protein KJZ61_01195 [Candidatus Dependentiae bacterium]|nr:hypothetical protein [Candidatus Dependentiae bacterium]